MKLDVSINGVDDTLYITNLMVVDGVLILLLPGNKFYSMGVA